MTFKQFATRQRGVSRRLSAQVVGATGEFGALQGEQTLLEDQFPKELRRSKRRWYYGWLTVNIVLCVYLTLLNIAFWQFWTVQCIRQLSVWLLVYNVLQGLQIVRTSACLAIWDHAEDPSLSQIKLEVFYGIWVFLAEAVWLIYGNTFIYDSEIANCDSYVNALFKKTTTSVTTLRNTAMVLIIYGYFLLIGIVVAVFFAVGAFLAYRSYVKNDLQTQMNMAAGVDAEVAAERSTHQNLLLTLHTMQTRRYTENANRQSNALLSNDRQTSNSSGVGADKMECGLCWVTFKMTDEVFTCKKMHCFHVACFEDIARDEE